MYLSGRHCCPWCVVTSEPLKIPRANRQISLRSLETLSQKHTSFLNNGGNIKKAKLYENVIGAAFFDITLTQVRIINCDPIITCMYEFVLLRSAHLDCISHSECFNVYLIFLKMSAIFWISKSSLQSAQQENPPLNSIHRQRYLKVNLNRRRSH